MAILVATLLLTLFVTTGRGTGAQQPGDDSFARAVKLHQSGDLDGAIGAYKEFLEKHPESVEARSNLGAVYARKGDYGRAIEEYKRALEFDDRNAAILFNLGAAYYKSAQINDAAALLARVLAAQPDNRNAAVLLADCHLRMGENKKVTDLLSPFSHKDDRALLYLLGTALIRDNQAEKGQALVDEILREGDSAEARLMLGTARMMGRDYRGALEEFARAVELNPKLPSVHSYFGRALLATGDLKRAMESFRRELELNAIDFDSNLYMGVLLRQEQKFGEALGYFQRALQIRPRSPGVRYQIGSLQLSTGNLREALQILEQLTKEEPDFVEAHVSLATVYYRLKRKEDGDRHREIVRRLNAELQARAPKPELEMDRPYRGETESKADPASMRAAREPPSRTRPATDPLTRSSETFDSLASRASSAREANRAGEAIELYKQALERQPSWHEGWWYLGTLLYEEDRYLEARDAVAKLISLKPEGGVGWAMLGLCEFQLKNYERSLEWLQKAQALGVPPKTQLSVVSRYHMALLLGRFGKPEAALLLLYALARDKSESPSILTAMGICALALPHLPAELPPDKEPLVSKAGLAQYYMATRQMAEARKASEELIARFPDTPNVHYSFGVFLLAEDPVAALEEFRRELRISPNHVPARLQIAFEYIKRNEHEKGLAYAQEAVKLSPDSFAARNALGRILLEMEQTQRAIEELEAGLELAPDSPEMHFAVARAYERAGRKDDAARAREEFKKLDRIRRTAREGSQAVGGIEPEKGRPPD